MELKRFNFSNKDERPTCPYQTNKGKCLLNCVHLIREDHLSGCSIDDKARAIVVIAESLSRAKSDLATSDTQKRGPGRPPKA